MVPRRTPWSLSRKLITGSGVVALVAGAAYGLTLIPGPSFDVSITSRRHLRQIPIDRAQACGEVEAIHAALDSFAQSYMAATLGMDSKTWNEFRSMVTAGTATSVPQPPATQPPAWPVIESEVDAAAQRLDTALAHGIPHFPRRLRTELTMVRNNITEGRQQLPKVLDVPTFKALTSRLFERGQLHAGYASDLVGRQCRVRLGA